MLMANEMRVAMAVISKMRKGIKAGRGEGEYRDINYIVALLERQRILLN